MQPTSLRTPATAGLDLSDKKVVIVELDAHGERCSQSTVPCTSKGLQRWASRYDGQRVVLEVGTHSPWVFRLLQEYSFEVVVANPRRVQLISQNNSKTDAVDAELLARLGRMDPALLPPITHRSEDLARHMVVLRSRAALVKSRTQLVNSVRAQVKATGARLPARRAQTFHVLFEVLSETLQGLLQPMFTTIEALSQQIRAYDRMIRKLCEDTYPETARLLQVRGVGPVTALTYVLTLGDPGRFQNSRQVGSYLGLRPRLDQSGEANPQLRITKAGDRTLRSLLVQCAHYILGPFGEDSDLRRWGLRLKERGGRSATHRAAVAVARKLAVLLHVLWRDGSDYQPLRPATS
jgi:transposase